MTIIKWRDAYNTGVEQFDMEHHKIVELINIMFEAIRDNSSKEVTEKACEEVLSYTKYHFNNEEQAMKAANYSGFEEQVVEHAQLKEKAEQFKIIIKSSFPEGRNEFYRFMRDWLINHIQECDKRYGPYLKSEPVAEQ